MPERNQDSNWASPREVFAILSNDVDGCFRMLDLDSGSLGDTGEPLYGQSEARSYVRAAFACMEGMTSCMRAWATERVAGSLSDKILPAGEGSAFDESAELESSVESMFTQLHRITRLEPQLGVGLQWWTNFRTAIQVRSRMAHPRLPADLVLARKELLTIVDADAGFRLLLSRYLEA